MFGPIFWGPCLKMFFLGEKSTHKNLITFFYFPGNILRGVQAFHFGKTYFELGVEWEDQDTSRHFEGSFGSIHAILPM